MGFADANFLEWGELIILIYGTYWQIVLSLLVYTHKYLYCHVKFAGNPLLVSTDGLLPPTGHFGAIYQ